MALIVLNLSLILLNVLFAYFNYKKGNYKIAMFNVFSCGFCLHSVLVAPTLLSHL